MPAGHPGPAGQGNVSLHAERPTEAEARPIVDLTKLDPSTMARQAGWRDRVGSMARRNWPVYEAAFKRFGVRPGERLFEVGVGNGTLVPRLLALAPGLRYTRIDFSRAVVDQAKIDDAKLEQLVLGAELDDDFGGIGEVEHRSGTLVECVGIQVGRPQSVDTGFPAITLDPGGGLFGLHLVQ
jgi:hypothetical protein